MSRTIPRAYVDGYADSLEVLGDGMRARLAEALADIDWTLPVAEVRELLIPIMQALCGASADVAATLAAEFYDGVREYMVGERLGAVNAPNYSNEATAQFVRFAVVPLVEGGPLAYPDVIERLNERVGYAVKSAAGNTVIRNSQRDPRRVRFARIPRASKTYPNGCPFCQMLASRGFVYASKRTAGEFDHYHDDCRCMVVPGFGDDPSVDGYDPRDYDAGYREWLDQQERHANTD